MLKYRDYTTDDGRLTVGGWVQSFAPLLNIPSLIDTTTAELGIRAAAQALVLDSVAALGVVLGCHLCRALSLMRAIEYRSYQSVNKSCRVQSGAAK